MAADCDLDSRLRLVVEAAIQGLQGSKATDSSKRELIDAVVRTAERLQAGGQGTRPRNSESGVAGGGRGHGLGEARPGGEAHGLGGAHAEGGS